MVQVYLRNIEIYLSIRKIKTWQKKQLSVRYSF